jgi:hypothetical protein
MNPLGIGKSYLLHLPDNRVLGRVRILKVEDDWAEGAFQAEEAFAELRILFEDEAKLRNDQIIPLWEEAADRIESLQIQVVAEDGMQYPHLRVFIEGDEAFLALPFTMPDSRP